MRPDSHIHWNAYPALLCAGCVALGIGVSAYAVTYIPYRGWLAGAGLAVVGAFCMMGYRPRRLVTPLPLYRTAALGLCLVMLGGLRFAALHQHPPTHLLHQHDFTVDAPFVWEGSVVSPPTNGASGRRFAFALTHRISPHDTTRLSGRIWVTLAQPRYGPAAVYPMLRRGDQLRLEGRLRPLPFRRNPADFDYGAYLARQGLFGTLTLYQPAHVVWRASDDGLVAVVEAARSYMQAQVRRYVHTPDGSMVLSTLLLGDRSGIDQETRAAFARTGLMHLLAVSGLHVLMVGMVLYGLLRPLLLRLGCRRRTMERLRAAVTMTLLLLYMVLTGAGASVVRAVLMAGLLILQVLLQRTSHTLNTLGVAGLAMLLFRPSLLFDIGFQLSFAAVAAIVSLVPALEKLGPLARLGDGPFRQPIALMLVSLAATLGTLPVLLFHFGRVALGGLLLNLPAIPLTGATMASGLLMVLCGGWSPPLAAAFGAAADAAAQGLLWTARLGDTLLGWMAWEGFVTAPTLVLALILVPLVLAQWPRPRYRWRLLVTLFGLLCTHTLGQLTAPSPALDVLFFDVGQGDAALVTTPNGRRLLVDAGPRDAHVDAGRRTLVPHLTRFGINRIDAVVLSHAHADHIGGLPTVLRSVAVGAVYHNGSGYASTFHTTVHHLLDSLSIPHHAVDTGDTLVLDPDVLIQVLAPAAPPLHADEENDASVVLRLAYGLTTVLFMGDAEHAAEAALSQHLAPLLATDVVKVGHHGSDTSSREAFVQAAARPGSWAFVSVGQRNRYGLPDEGALDRWTSYGAQHWRTDQQGALWLRSDGTAILPVPWRKR